MVVRDESIPATYSPTIQSPQDIYRLATTETDLIDLDREAIYAIHLDARNKVLGIEMVSLGTLNSSLVHPRETFKSAILTGASGLILLHNHPSNDPKPSEEDIQLTARISKAGEILGIELLDHLIVCAKGHYSMKQEHPRLFGNSDPSS